MTPVRMVHEKHGATHAYDHAELDRLKSYGWKPEGESLVEHIAATAAADAAFDAKLDAPKKRGRPRKS